MCRKFRLLPIYALIASVLLDGGCRNPKVSSLAEQVSFRVPPVNDFISLWRGEEDSYEKDDELTLWLLEHFNTKRQNPATEYERFQCLKDCIERLFDYEPETQIELNDWSSLRRRLQEFYARILLKETIKLSDKVVASALLDGAAKDFYDNATNNLRRRKLIMLKNRYEGYGVTSAFLKSCLLPYDCDDSEIAGFSFERNFESY